MNDPNDQPTMVDPEVPQEDPQNPAAPEAPEVVPGSTHPTRLPEDPT